MINAPASDVSAPVTPAPNRGLSPAAQGDLVIGGFMVILSGLLVVGTVTMDVIGGGGLLGPQGAGWLVASLAAILGLILIIGAFAKRGKPAEDAAAEKINIASLIWVIAGLGLFTLLVEMIGWLVMATILFALVAIGLGNRRILQSVAVGFIMASVIQIVFSGFLEISLPAGILGGLL